MITFPKRLGVDAPKFVIEHKPNAKDPIRVLLQIAGRGFDGLLYKDDENEPWGVALSYAGKRWSFTGKSTDDVVMKALVFLEGMREPDAS